MREEIAYPERQSADARLADRELVAVLEALLIENETITVRASVRRMMTLSQASTVTRDAWRMAQVLSWQTEQGRLRSLSERSDKDSKTNVAASLEFERAKVARLESEVSLLRGGMIGVIQALGESGGIGPWLKFFEKYQETLDHLKKSGVVPTAEVVALMPTPGSKRKPK